MAEPMQNLHVPLPRSVYAELRSFAESTGRPATVIAREAIDRWLVEQRRTARRAAIAAYAAEHAGTKWDLDPQLERAAVEHLRRAPRKRKRAK
jgi:predicted transcriptional regulator